MDIPQIQMSNHQSDIYGQEKDTLRDSQTAFTMDSDLDSLFAAQDSAMQMSGDSSSSSHGSPNDWSTVPTPSFWPTEPQLGLKDFGALNDMNMAMEDPSIALDFLRQMEMDFNPSMAIDPTALHFTYPDSQDYGVFANDIGTGAGEPFPFTFGSHPSPSIGSVSSGDDSSSKERRLSFGSSADAPSPAAVEYAQVGMPNSTPSAADALADRVRRSAGVLLAVPSGNNNNNTMQNSQRMSPLSQRKQILIPILIT